MGRRGEAIASRDEKGGGGRMKGEGGVAVVARQREHRSGSLILCWSCVCCAVNEITRLVSSPSFFLPPWLFPLFTITGSPAFRLRSSCCCPL